MHFAKVDSELESFKEYSTMVASWSRIGTSKVNVTTLEGTQISAELTEAGWILDDGSCYETPEAFLGAHSSRFQIAWNEMLYQRLEETAALNLERSN